MLFSGFKIQLLGLRNFNHHVQVTHSCCTFMQWISLLEVCLSNTGLIISSVTTPAKRRTFSSQKSKQLWCWRQPWPWVTCSVHKGTSLLLWSDQRAMRRRLVRVWHTAAHMTAEAKRGSLKRNKHNESQSGWQPEVSWWQVISFKGWNILVSSERGGFPLLFSNCVLLVF